MHEPLVGWPKADMALALLRCLLLVPAYKACSALPFREALGENKDVSKGITDVKFFEAPGLRPDLRRSNHIGCQILLVQGLDITYSRTLRSVWEAH